MIQECRTCKFWFSKRNECRRFPPSVGEQQQRSVYGTKFMAKREPLWPSTNASMWCGEFELKEAYGSSRIGNNHTEVVSGNDK